jgi:hypothetical protein
VGTETVTCQQAVRDNNGEIETEVCGKVVGEYGMCEGCRQIELEFLHDERHRAKKDVTELERRIFALGGGL